jgi:predicted SAM-dependent methyltransferase
MKLHIGCGEKYLEGYVNIDFPDSEQSIIHTKADIYYKNMGELSYPENSIDEIRSHHLFEHFSRAEALKLLVRWRSWLKPGGLLVIETPDFTTSAVMFLNSTSLKRRFELARHIFGSEEAGWANHKDYWDKEKYLFVLSKLGFEKIKTYRYWNGLARHADKIPKIGVVVSRIPESVSRPFLNMVGNMLPASFYKKFGSHKMPNILVRAVKNDSAALDTDAAAREIFALSLVGHEGDEMLNVWMEDYKKF